jgi:SAM-dependent methyltransferase
MDKERRAEWPGRDRRFPRPWQAGYLSLKPLSRLLQQSIGSLLQDRTDLKVLDVGCGAKPYFPFFADRTSHYVGLNYSTAYPDTTEVCGDAASLPFADGIFDVVVCTQVLEHVEEPERTIGEISRVLKANGVLYLSTHGNCHYHPQPGDHWRWTHTGLERLLRTASTDGWEDLRIYPTGGTLASLCHLHTDLIDTLVHRRFPFLRVLSGLVLTILHLMGEGLDRFGGPLNSTERRYTLFYGYLVIARKGT